jgi:capsular exopolysaccharide synthesis family protein
MKTIANTLPTLLRTHLRWILLITLAVTAGAAVYSWSRTPMYRAEAEVLVDPLVVAGMAPETPNMETEKELASSGAVLEAASSSVAVRARDLSRGISVTVPVDSRVLRITYAHRNPREAARIAQALADAYVAFHSDQQGSRPSGRSGQDAANRPMGSLAGAVQGVVITPAAAPRSPATPNHLVDLAVAVFVGLSLGIGSAILRDRMDDRLRGPEDVETQAGRPVLATIPPSGPVGPDPASQLVMVRDPDSPVAEAYRDLRTLLLRTANRQGAKTLLVTSPSGEGTTVVTANLAAAMAQSGRRVVLVCADLRRPRTHEMFGVDNEAGLTTVVNGRLDLPKALLATNVDGLRLLAAGEPADPGAVLLAPALQKTLDELRNIADLVVVDAPPVLAGPDTAIVAELVEMILLVAEAQRTTGTEVWGVAHQEQIREKLVGCVLDNAGRRPRPSEVPHRHPDTRDRASTTSSTQDDGRLDVRVPATARSEHEEPMRSSNSVDLASGK